VCVCVCVCKPISRVT